MPMPMKSDPERFCAACNRKLWRKRINGRMEDRAIFLRRKYCDQRCMAKGQMKENPTRNSLLKRIRHLRKVHCESCGTNRKRLTLHHKDRNWRNNDPVNIQTLCSSCHTSLHHANGEIVPRAKEQPCKYCGVPMLHRSVCDTCRSRIRKFGADFARANAWNFSKRRVSPPGR